MGKGKGLGGPVLPDIKTIIAAGLDPKTGLPIKLIEDSENDKNDFRRIFRIIDEQDAVNRYKWYNLPCDISSEFLERMLYYKGQLCFFYFKDLDKFYFLPFALDGTIDFYGRFNRIHPIPFSSGTTDSGQPNETYKSQLAILSLLKLNVIKEAKDLEELKLEDLDNSAVILYDYQPQMNVNNIIPRATLNDALLDVEAEILPYMQTALLAGTGIKGMRVNDADAAAETDRASKQIRYSALNRKLYVSMTASVEFQDLADGSPMKTEEFLLALQGIDNIRKSTLGIENGGIFQKKAHKLESEQNGNESSVQTVYQDGLSLRQHFCNIVNSIWGTEIWCMPSEAVIGQDLNGDGVVYDIENNPEPLAKTAPEGGEENVVVQ